MKILMVLTPTIDSVIPGAQPVFGWTEFRSSTSAAQALLKLLGADKARWGQ